MSIQLKYCTGIAILLFFDISSCYQVIQSGKNETTLQQVAITSLKNVMDTAESKSLHVCNPHIFSLVVPMQRYTK